MSGANRPPYPCVMTGDEVEAAMTKMGLSAQELSGLMGVSKRLIDHWRSGDANIGPAHAYMLLHLKSDPHQRAVIAVHGLEKYLRRTIRSLKLQTVN